MAPKKDYTPQQMGWAIEAVKKGFKISEAAKKFNVPRITLYNKVTGKSPIECSMGPRTILSKEEEYILEIWIKEMLDKHIPVTKEDLMDSVKRIIVDKNQETPFKDNRPGKKWYSSFLKRHPTIAERVAQNLCTARDNVTQEDIEKWFLEVENDLKDRGLLEILKHPERVFNTDESAFFLNPKAGHVLARKGDKNVYTSSGDDKENLTVLVTGNAAGELAPTLVVFNYARIPSLVSETFPDEWAIGRSESGWMCSGTFYEYITNVFHPWLTKKNIEKPIIFFLDGHKSHLTLHLSNFCSDNGIEVIALNPNSTHILQPMDLAVFRPLKSSWREAVKNWKMQHLGQLLKKQHFAPLLKTAMEKISAETVKNGFRAGGLFPFGPEYVDMTKIKSQNRQKISESKDQNDFLKALENKIEALLSKDKLKLFKDLYYKTRSELENLLPNEDISLYLIWANIKQTDVVNEESSISVSAKYSTNATSRTSLREIQTVPVLTSNINDSASSTSHTNCLDKEQLISTNPADKSNPAPETTNNPNFNESPKDIRTVPVLSCNININYSEPSTSSQKKCLSIETSDLNSADMENVVPRVITDIDDSSLPKSSHKTPMKTVNFGTSNYVIPSPFKRNLFWPETDETTKNKKRKLKEKIPFTVTSPAWKAYNAKKEEQKRKQLEEKALRAKKREDKRLEKLNKKSKVSKQKNKSESSETETEIVYAESDNSVLSEGSESDDAPLSTLVPSQQKLSKESYVIVLYEGQHFPGVVENTNKNEFEVSTMTFSTGNTYKWPEKPDKMWYQRKDIVECISPPILINKRGFYTVKEMQKYSVFTI